MATAPQPSSGAGGPPAPPGCEVRPATSKGFGLFATGGCGPGTRIFTEDPLFVLQHTGNRRVVGACARCCGFVGSLQGQLEVLFGEARFAALLGSLGGLFRRWQESTGCGTVVRCSQGCGEIYCSEACRDAHFRHSHNLLCVGLLDREDHPLLRFKYHALEHADTLLLAAQVMAHLVNRSKALGGGAQVAQQLAEELLNFCHAPFRDACRAPPGRSKDAEFLAHTDGLIAEAATLLRQSLEPHAPAEVAALFQNAPALLAELMGLFEYNNIDVEVNSPLGPLINARVAELLATGASDPQASEELQLLDRLLREKEWVMRCVWGEETTGIFNDDDDDIDDSASSVGDADTSMGDEAHEAEVAMAEARTEVEKMSMEQLLQAPWPSLHGTALFASVARMNHSCAPNMKIEFPGNSACLSAVSLTAINPGDELCISYIKQEADVITRRRQLLEYGFTCSCSRCLAEDSGIQRKAQKRLK